MFTRYCGDQELQLQQFGLPAFSDPSPWQRLSRGQQLEFNRKYLALPRELRVFSRGQFLSLPEQKQMRAYSAFLRLDSDTLRNIIQKEMRTVHDLEEANNVARVLSVSEDDLQEQLRTGAGVRVPGFEFNSIENKSSVRMKSKYDPRRRNYKSKQLKQRQNSPLKFLRSAEKLHFQYAQAQLKQAVRIQACLQNPNYCL